MLYQFYSQSSGPLHVIEKGRELESAESPKSACRSVGSDGPASFVYNMLLSGAASKTYKMYTKFRNKWSL